METAKHVLELSEKELENVSRVIVNPHECHVESSFYEIFAIRGIRVDRVQPGLISCTFKDRTGNLAVGAIANLIDMLGSVLAYEVGKPVNVTVDLSILYLSNAKLDDELELTARLVGKIGVVSGTSIIITKKASGEIVAEGRNSMFTRLKSKI
ncbi:hypothetical protein BVRB_7g168180 isoform B [Beta vulgaris subsp. vulgaris]|uniref:Thioesterase domain-containing protein n=1 Tax=Beta vulgaris subsp. vulgaris TaxID=3555 RepID=A0A0J8BVF4_BETVV|nr:uncharacterized protein LOC104899586 isoform X2 [Beta vulgaris subsp. vulgaris]KMT05575.1 hypothetical protein BVRB_7g168180 isoform B [Beta vulgaris subsp. vulgaris]